MNSAETKNTDQTLYTCRITILRVNSVPVADFNDLSCDPYLQLTLSTDTLKDAVDPQLLTYRTQTCRRTLDPEYNAQWIVAGIPDSGFILSCRLRDEDPGNYDDDLGKAVLRIPNQGEGKLYEGWSSGEREYKVHKRKGSLPSKVFTCIARVVTRGDIGHRVRLWLSVEVLAKSENQKDRRLYTVGPRRYARHFSPLLGMFLGSSNSPDNSGDRAPGSKVQPTAFIANRIQLAGPVPETLRHRYVGFAPFVKAMFRRRGIRGLVLHHALHRQHLSIYKWDKNVVWGVIEGTDGENKPRGEVGNEEKKGAAEQESSGTKEQIGEVENKEVRRGQKLTEGSVELARQFLRMTSCGTRGRIFTYVIMLDGEWRFTETGEQLAIEYISKHTMHSDVSVEIAYSGEFFVRRLRHRKREPISADSQPAEPESDSNDIQEQQNGDEQDKIDGHRAQGTAQQSSFNDESPPEDPALYELVIDNDSGTYRPRADLLPTLHSYLASPMNLGALGRITCIQAFDDRLKRWKEARKKAKLAEGHKAIQPGSLSSSASSSVSSLGGADQGNGEKPQVGDMQAVVEEDAKRARENEDKDKQAKEEEGRAP